MDNSCKETPGFHGSAPSLSAAQRTHPKGPLDRKVDRSSFFSFFFSECFDMMPIAKCQYARMWAVYCPSRKYREGCFRTCCNCSFNKYVPLLCLLFSKRPPVFVKRGSLMASGHVPTLPSLEANPKPRTQKLWLIPNSLAKRSILIKQAGSVLLLLFPGRPMQSQSTCLLAKPQLVCPVVSSLNCLRCAVDTLLSHYSGTRAASID